ncbi:hypothetical protein H671_6g16908 [Cricetulus griseus]|nr:hypothetical protein H671_6g16908 [Cricetulus griseus]
MVVRFPVWLPSLFAEATLSNFRCRCSDLATFPAGLSPQGSRVSLLPPLLTEKLTLECGNLKYLTIEHYSYFYGFAVVSGML